MNNENTYYSAEERKAYQKRDALLFDLMCKNWMATVGNRKVENESN